MDKIKVNNQIVSMRKFVKQAKIHAINKCTKQIKFLENRKGNEEQMAKTKRKHQRLLEEVTLLKKIKPDSVSKLALSKAKDWKVVLAEKNIPLEDRCFAMLANHPPVQEAVEKFLSDNSELIAKIPELVKQWEGKKSRSSQIYKKNQKGKKNNTNDPNTLPIGNKSNFNKSDKVQASQKNTESLKNLSNNSINLQNDITEQNSTIEKVNKRKGSFDDLDPTDSLIKKRLLVIGDKKSYTSDDNYLSDSSDFENHQKSQIKQKLSVKSKTNPQSYKNLKQSEVFSINQANSTKKMTPKEKAVDSGHSNETKIESNNEEHSEKSQDIVSKLLKISKTIVPNKPRNKTSSIHQQSNTDSDSGAENSSDAVNNSYDGVNVSSTKTNPSTSSKPGNKNKMKAVTVLDLNELQDMDEIPIEKSDSDVEDETDEDSGKLKKDPFFLRDGESVSESDEAENEEKETARKKDFPTFKKKPYGNFRERKDNSFQIRRFEKHSVNERNSSFRENSFTRNRREFSFKDDKRNFKQIFDNTSDNRQNKNFELASKDKYNKRNGTNNFTKIPKEKTFSKYHNRDGKGNSYDSNPNLNNLPKKNKTDDKPLHPSWEAKRKLKEAANTKFQGKRMVFND